MFSLDDGGDDDFDLSEEDILQAAVNMERNPSSYFAQKPNSSNQSSYPQATGATAFSSSNTKSKDSVIKSSELRSKAPATPMTPPLFKLHEDSDDSQLDLSLDSPVAWKPVLPRKPVQHQSGHTLLGNAGSENLLKTTFAVITSTSPSGTPEERSSVLTDPDIPAQCHSVLGNKHSESPISFKFPNQPLPSSSTHSLDSTASCLFATPTGIPVQRKRKFPGPAGLLPKLKPGDNLNELASTDHVVLPDVISKKSITVEDLPSSQSTEDHFNEGNWQRMMQDLEPQANDIVKQFSIAAVSRKASRKHLPNGKVPILCGVIESISLKNSDASISLKDPSGSIRGTVHRDLVKEYGNYLQPGSVLVLRQVGVFSPMSRNHYLNITPSNLVRLYSQDLDGQLTLNKLNSFVSEDFTIPPLRPHTPSRGFNSPTARVSLPVNRPQNSPAPWNAVGRSISHASPRFTSLQTGPRFVKYSPPVLNTPPRQTLYSNVKQGTMNSTNVSPNTINSSVARQQTMSNNVGRQQSPSISNIQRGPGTPTFNGLKNERPSLQQPTLPGAGNVQNGALTLRYAQSKVVTADNTQLCGGAIPSLPNAESSADIQKTGIQSAIIPGDMTGFTRNSSVNQSKGPQNLSISFQNSLQSNAPSNIHLAESRVPLSNLDKSNFPVSTPNIQGASKSSVASSPAQTSTPSGKFTFKRTKSTQSQSDFSVVHQGPPPSSSSVPNNPWKNDAISDLLTGVEHELFDDDF